MTDRNWLQIKTLPKITFSGSKIVSVDCCKNKLVTHISQTWNALCPSLIHWAEQLEELNVYADDG